MDNPTVLLLGTLTNRRGQVVSAAWLTAEFPVPEDPAFALVTPHPSAAEAFSALGWDTVRSNPGRLPQADSLSKLIEPAVVNARVQMHELFAAAEKDVAHRVEEWSRRLDQWQHDADALIQRRDLKHRRVSIEQEQKLVAEMNPDRQLVRPLLVVLPSTAVQA